MKVINKTEYITDDLRAIVRAIVKEECGEMSVKRKKKLTVAFIPSNNRLHGHAHIDSCSITCYLPKKPKAWIQPEWIQPYVCLLVAHELLHVASERHGRSFELHYRKTARYGYAGHYSDGYAETLAHWKYMEGYPLRKVGVEVKAKPTTEEKIQNELDRLDSRQATWATKLKRAETSIKTIEKRRKTLTRRLAKRKG